MFHSFILHTRTEQRNQSKSFGDQKKKKKKMRNPSTSAGTNKGTPCCSKVGMKRGPWTPEEDELLAKYINKEGEGRWRTLPKRAGLLRCGKSCRLRWMNYLRPSVKRGQIAPDEEDLILRLHRLLGNRWSLIAGRIPGRTDNEIKNYWNTHLSKKLISQGIDPRTHKPLNLAGSSSAVHANNKNAASSSSKANPNPVIVPPSESEENNTSSKSRMFVSTNKENGYLPNTSFDDGGYTSLLNCDHHDPGLGLGSNVNVNEGISNEEDEDINYCTDDIFSTFLNSLINEDAFASHQHPHQQQQQQQQPTGNIAPPESGSDPLVSITASALGLGAVWESAIMSSSSFNQNEQKTVKEQVE